MKQNMIRYFSILLFTFFAVNLNAQVGVGQWRDHFHFQNINSAYQMSDGRIVAVAQNGLFYIEDDGSISRLTKVNGLYDVGISSTEYFYDFNTLVIGYENGNIDIVTDDGVVNISEIKRKNISGDKNIYSISGFGQYAYLSCGFGIVKLDAQNAEIIDTYYIGDNASYVKVYKVVETADSVFAATDVGLLGANKNTFLADYTNWNPVFTSEFSSFTDIHFVNNQLFFIAKNDEDQTALLKRNTDGRWQEFATSIKSQTKIYGKSKLFVPSYNSILVFSFNGYRYEKISELGDATSLNPTFVFENNDGELLIGDKKNGVYVENFDEFYSLNGVYNDEGIQVKAASNLIVVSRGGYTSTGANLWKKSFVNVFQNQQWTNLEVESSSDFYSISIDENSNNHFYIGSWGYGLYEYKDNELINHYDYTNSPLETVIANRPYLRVSGMDIDNENNLWIFSQAINNPVNILKSDGNWVSYSLNNIISDANTGDLKILSSNLVWASLPGRGFLAIDINNTIDNTGDDIYKIFYPFDETAENIGSEIICFEEDNEGDIWFGTDEGVGVIYNPLGFNDAGFYASRIKITAVLNDSLTTNYLLKSEKILSLSIDGGNRKWFGTEGSGVYLMNSTGTTELLHFDTENSPLPSNQVFSISVEPTSGEVFFVTSKGVVSYRGDATVADNKFANVYAFPNPVRENYSGPITITGLAENVNVKITDVAGNIVFETNANGGQAVWDGNNFNGRRVATGVYLIFCSNSDGSETFVSKLLFIN